MLQRLSRTLLTTYRPERMKAFTALERDQWREPDLIAERSREKLTALLRTAGRDIPFYRDVCRGGGLDPSRLTADDLRHFPLVDKHILMDRQERFLAPSAPPSKRVPNHTGGSSGVNFHFFNDRSALEVRKGNDMRGRAWTGWRPGDKQAVLWAHPRDNREARSLKGRILAGLVHRTRTLNAYDMDESVVRRFQRELTDYRPAMMLGFASSLAYFAEFLLRKGLTVPAPRGIISSAESLTDDQRAVIEECFPCPLLNRYGSREFGVIAQQCSAVAGLHVFIDQVHLEILGPDGEPCRPGERGEIVITDLDNRVMPFIRYRTGDLARWSGAPCSCGRGLPVLEAVEGRTSELLVGRNGKIYSCLGPRFFGGDLPGIVQMQVIQESLDRIVLRLVQDDAWTEDTGRRLVSRLHDLLGEVEVELQAVPSIEPSPSGKYRFTISRVSPFNV